MVQGFRALYSTVKKSEASELIVIYTSLSCEDLILVLGQEPTSKCPRAMLIAAETMKTPP